MVPSLKNMNYNQRLEKMKLPRLYDRRVRGDMIETFKILTGKEKLNARKLFRLNPFNGRSHTMKLYRECPRLNLRKHWFTQRVVQNWNSLTLDEVEAGETSCFKAR